MCAEISIESKREWTCRNGREEIFQPKATYSYMARIQ